MSGKVKVWGNPVTVEWADPVAEPDPEVMAKVGKSFLFVCLFVFLSIFPEQTHISSPRGDVLIFVCR